MDSRLDRFRRYYERLDPESRPSAMLSEDRYAEPPGRATGEQLASRLKLAPSSSHLVTGAVGTGKTTQLYRAAEVLRSGPGIPDVVAKAAVVSIPVLVNELFGEIHVRLQRDGPARR